MTVNHIRIPIELFKLPAQGLYKTSILALICNFDGTGLKLSNGKLAELFSTDKRTVEKAIASLKTQGLITDTGTNNYNRCLVLTTDKLTGSSTALLAGSKHRQSTVKLTAKYRKTYRQTTVKLTDHKERKKVKKAQTARSTQKPVCEKPPTEEEVREYSTTQGVSDFDAKHFVEYYAANQWRHKDGKPVRNWRQTVLTWLRRDRAKEAAKPEPKRGDPDWLPTEEEAEAVMKECGML